MTNPIALNLGCGKRAIPGTLGVDIAALPGVKVVANLDGTALPFADGIAKKIYIYHVLEHMHDLKQVMEEIHRICVEGAEVIIEVPYYACVGAFGDPTHVHFFTYNTFNFWTADTDQANWFTWARFTVARRQIVFGRLHCLMGIAWWANRWPHLYENFFAFWFPARLLEATLIVKK